MSQLTLGILTYNNGVYLPILLESLKSQIDSEFKIIVINNGSTDNTMSILENFSRILENQDIKVIHNKFNSGSFRGLQQLLKQTETDYLSIIHGDDVLKNDYVEVAKFYAKTNPQKAAFNLDLEQIDSEGKHTFEPDLTSGWTHFCLINRLLVSGLNPGIMPGSILNVKLLGNDYLDNFFDGEKLNGTEDIYLWLKIARDSREIKRIPKVTYQYRRHVGQVSKNKEIYAFSLGYVRRLNYMTSSNLVDKFLAIVEIDFEFSSMNYSDSYLDGLDFLIKYRHFSRFRFINVFLRRSVKFINSVMPHK